MSSKIVPTISSGIAGPLGILHLPRLWQKLSLEECGKLADGYPGIGGGYDSMVIAGLGLEKDPVRKFVKETKPTYPQFEAWIATQPGVKLDKASVDKLNASIRGYIHDDETRKEILGANKIEDCASAPKDAVNLNNLDDWHAFHHAVLK